MYISYIQGMFEADDEEPALTIRVLDHGADRPDT